MRAAVLEADGAELVVADDVVVRDPAPGEVLVRVRHCGICHSDLTVVEQSHGMTPVVLGHEAAGTVEALGDAVTGLTVGDQVVLTPLGPCGHCYWCARHQPTLCVEAQTFAYGVRADGTSPLSRGGEIVYQGLGVGAFGELVNVERRNVVRIDPDIPLDVACVVGCAVQTGVGAVVNTASVEPGATVLVMGLGGIGLSIVQGARLAGAGRIIGSDPVADRRSIAANLGATDVLDPTETDVVAAARELTGGIGVDYAFDGAGAAALVAQGLEATRLGGTTVMVGAPAVTDTLTVPMPVLLVTTEKKLLGSLLGSCHSHRDIPRFLELWRQGRLDLEALITKRLALDEINAGLDDLRASHGIRTVVDLG
ncbi:MAG: Zn-dependent alcohol dehydrogenase [Acidimicrobiales bacterium]